MKDCLNNKIFFIDIHGIIKRKYITTCSIGQLQIFSDKWIWFQYFNFQPVRQSSITSFELTMIKAMVYLQ